MKSKRYVFVEENKIVAKGTAKELAEILHSSLSRVYNQYARTKAGKTRFKHIFLEEELTKDKLASLETRDNLKTLNHPDERAAKDEKLYAIYHGDEFVDVGSAKELTTKHRISLASFYSRVSRSKSGKYKKNVIVVVP